MKKQAKQAKFPRRDDDIPPLIPIDGGAVAGGGIGGEMPIEQDNLQEQLLDLEVVNPERMQAIRERIEEANQGRQQQQDLRQEIEQINRERRALVRDVKSLLPGDIGTRKRVREEGTRALKPLVDIFYDNGIRPFLTEAYDDDETFRECFDFNHRDNFVDLNDERQQLVRTGFELLIKESIVQGIRVPQLVWESFTQLLFNNDRSIMMISAGGSIMAIIIARDFLRFFSNTIIGFMTFGWLNVAQLTSLCVFVYRNCSLANIRNLLIYFNVSSESAQQFIDAIRHFNREQREYIIMTIYLCALNTIGRRINLINEEQINGILRNVQNFMGIGIMDEQALNAADAPIIQEADDRARARAGAGAGAAAAAAVDQAAAAAAAAADLNAAAAAANPAAEVIAPPRGELGPTIFEIFREALTDIKEFIKRTFRNGWARGLRMTASCLRDVFTLYLVRRPRGEGLRCDLVNLTGRITRWGVAALQERSAVLDPAKPNQEIIRLLAAVMGLTDAEVRDPVRCEAALYDFAQNLKLKAINLLQPNYPDQMVYLNEQDAPGCLGALRDYFIPESGVQENRLVNMERTQNACLGMRLFVSEHMMRSDVVFSAIAERRQAEPDFNDTQGAVASLSESLERIQGFILQNNDDTVTANLFRRAHLYLQAFANLRHDALAGISVALRQNEPQRSVAEVLAEQLHRGRIPTKEHIKSAIQGAINAQDIPQQRKEDILQNLIPRVDEINFIDIENYLLRQNPNDGIPMTFANSCRAFIRDTPAEYGNAVYMGLSRCAASLTNLVAVGSGAVIDTATAGIRQVRTLFDRVFAADPAVPANPLAENILHNIDAVLPPAVEHGLDVEVDENLDGGSRSRSRSRKRSAPKRTRRKGKQSLKRKSRKYLRRASSRKARK